MKPTGILGLVLFSLVHSLRAQDDLRLDGSAEWMQSDDIGIQTIWTALGLPVATRTTLTGRIEFSRHSVDYRPNAPVDPFGQPVDMEESLHLLQLDLKTERGFHQASVSINAYEGFRNPSAIWIDRYYRQQYGNGGIPGVSYTKPDPQGIGTTVTYRYEAIPAAGYLTFSLGYLYDEVAPGYEIEDLGNTFALVKSEEHLHTWTGAIDWEGVVNSRARTRQSFRLTDTTDRDFRFSWIGGLNTLIADRWISRTNATFATENPDFDAWSLAQTLEYNLTDHWSLALTLRYYEDTGQIESANLVSSAAPELSSKQAYLTLRYTGWDQATGFAISMGPYATRYGPTGIGTERFLHLYKDRDWIWTRMAARISF